MHRSAILPGDKLAQANDVATELYVLESGKLKLTFAAGDDGEDDDNHEGCDLAHLVQRAAESGPERRQRLRRGRVRLILGRHRAPSRSTSTTTSLMLVSTWA